jgi:hypothetical protein
MTDVITDIVGVVRVDHHQHIEEEHTRLDSAHRLKQICFGYYQAFQELGFASVTPAQVIALGIERDEQLDTNLVNLIVGYCNFKLAIGTEVRLPPAKRKPLASAIRIEVLRRDGNKCRECGRTAGQVPLEIHHVVPVAKGGTDEMSNLITLCKSCNDSISDRRYKPV